MPERRSNTADHDLLITIDTKLERAIADIGDLKNTTSKRVDALENDKADKTTTNDHERRLRRLEWYGAIAVGILYAIEIYLKLRH